MKSFLRRLIVISSIFCLLLVILIVAGNLIIGKKAGFKIKDTDTLVIFGHSHAECAYNDSLISNFKNLSSSGESYFYTFAKVKKVIAQNPQIKTVLIEFSNNQVSKRMDEWIWGDDFMLEKYQIYAPFLALQEHKFLFTHNYKGYINSLSFALKKQIFTILTNNYAYTDIVGGYLYNKVNKVDSLIAVQKSSVNTATYSEISDENIKCLREIIDFCHQNHKQVFLIRTPTHRAYQTLKNEATFQHIRHKYFDSIPFLDLAGFPINNAEFADLEHLNYYGARKYSIWFGSLLNAGLLSQTNMQQFINERL